MNSAPIVPVCWPAQPAVKPKPALSTIGTFTWPPLMARKRGASLITWSIATSMNSAMYSSTTGR